MVIKVIVALILCFFALLIYASIKYPESDIKLIIKYGFPGVGKTTDICRECIKAIKKGRKVYTTVPDIGIPGVIKFNAKDFGHYRFYGDCVVLIDEAGIVFNNRNWKSFTDSIEYSKLHRHDKARIILYSQSPEDTDVTLRRLCQEAWDMKKVFGCFSVQRRIVCENTIVKSSSEDGTERGTYGSNQKFAGIIGGMQIYYMPWYFGLTDSFQMPERYQQIPCTVVSGNMPIRFQSLRNRLQYAAYQLYQLPQKVHNRIINRHSDSES